MLHALDAPLDRLSWLDARAIKACAAFGYRTVAELLGHYPRRYEDRRTFQAIPDFESEENVCLRVLVTDSQMKFAGRGRRYFEATVKDADLGMGAPLALRWFNMPYMQKIIAVDQVLVLYGKVKRSGKRLVMDHPDYEILSEADDSNQEIHLGRIVPVYPLRDGASQKQMREVIFRVLDELDPDSISDFFLATDAGFANWDRVTALRAIHFPNDSEGIIDGRKYLAFEELFLLQMEVIWRRKQIRQLKGLAHTCDGRWLVPWMQSLPFSPTSAQMRAIDEIRDDLRAGFPMNRLLQGDVGSGKTLVAVASLLLAIESGKQAALMAPTQILAEQHFRTLEQWLTPLGIQVALRTGNRSEDNAMPLFSGTESRPQIFVGTHALLYDRAGIEDLGLVVVDEQHKFGVAQRAKLQSRGTAPDILVMTATPIPRTLTNSVFGDLDVSVLDELPAGRGKIITAVREIGKTPEAAKFVLDQIAAGRQAYVVFPLIEESEKLSAKAAISAFEEWSKLVAPHAVALLHGRMSSEEKDAVMRSFREGKAAVLVSTTVIEVGVDVPNANVMLIYNAERFGLAQLHQLRGRIGRGAHKSYCILMSDTTDESALAKLRVLEKSTDGFFIAEEDLKLRGPGDLLGAAQSGHHALKLASLTAQPKLMLRARDLALLTLDRDPKLDHLRNAPLRQHLFQRESQSPECSDYAEVS